MKYAIDQIIDDVIILENIKTKERIEINKKSISFPVKEGNILIKENNIFHLDQEEENNRRNTIQEKLNNLKGD